VKKFNFRETKNGKLPIPYFSTSRVYWPLVVKNEELYIPQNLIFNEAYLPRDAILPTVNTKICIIIKKNGQNEYLPMDHPLMNEDGLNTVHYSRDFDGNKFIYSFFADPNVYITKDYAHVEKYYAQSRFIRKIKLLKYNSLPSIEKANKDFVTNGFYHNVLYDKYRNLYYRFVKLPDDYDEKDDLMKLVKYPQNFSIIVLNKDFEVIGETKLPSKMYVFTDAFVAEKGLYLSINHIDNPNLDINALQFELIKLEYNEN
jgi:hypothetical protein